MNTYSPHGADLALKTQGMLFVLRPASCVLRLAGVHGDGFHRNGASAVVLRPASCVLRLADVRGHSCRVRGIENASVRRLCRRHSSCHLTTSTESSNPQGLFMHTVSGRRTQDAGRRTESTPGIKYSNSRSVPDDGKPDAGRRTESIINVEVKPKHSRRKCEVRDAGRRTQDAGRKFSRKVSFTGNFP